MNCKVKFEYDKYGYGPLCFYKDNRLRDCFPCRTGSINRSGQLVNAIYPGLWHGIEYTELSESHREIEPSLFIKINGVYVGIKLRLQTPDGKWSHYLIHFDGSIDGEHDGNGSDGCVVSLKRHLELKEILKNIMAVMRVLPVEVTR